MFGRRRASKATPPAEDAAPLDALVTLGEHHIPPGATVAESIASVRAAADALPGAGWISVQHHPVRPVAETVDWVARDEADPARAQRFRAALETAVAAALNALAQITANRPTPPQPAPLGFAEAPVAALAPPRLTALHPAPAADIDLASLPDATWLQRLLAMATGTSSASAATRAGAEFGSLPHVLAAPAHALLEVPGIGVHSAAAIKLVHALALRAARGALMGQDVAAEWDPLLAYLRSAIAREKVEQFRILFLDGNGRLLADEAQARGTVNHTPVYPREVVRRALELRARSLILVHNHPSGDPTPSPEDLAMTAQVEQAGRVVDITVFDHLIVVTGRCVSFREAGLLTGGQTASMR